ncbi:PTS system mannose/fructose/sorbose family IID component [Clostridium sp. DL-VIII]|uniref:PTS system mannose/fructose/sorbose family transporter subunit IID n=1 Tax=Clostridium sp. DL-VIII TaxID=641107 RepID=UPI00023B0171|nr:PTS system mannose/fructose/sorbose family transporter subunit IID [Clostridium sp. DL-VIII]EHI99231.1 PTS system mannose/fructose/sorbose family IID component [Clostridium sp. DL-VIII]
MDNEKVTKKDLLKAFVRSNFYMLSSNFERMQALGVYYSITPLLKKLYKNKSKEEKVAAIKRHLEFFNTNPYVYGPILGITMAMEESTTESEKSSVTSIKTGLMGPLAGVGDSLLALTLYPIIASIGASLAISGNVLGPILFFVIFNAIIYSIKYSGLMAGYKKGTSLFNSNDGSNMIQSITNIASVIGMMVIGAIIVSSVKINSPIQFTVGESTLKIQTMLDQIMPNLLPLVVTIISYFLLRKGKGKNAVFVILGVLVVSVILSMLGILA